MTTISLDHEEPEHLPAPHGEGTAPEPPEDSEYPEYPEYEDLPVPTEAEDIPWEPNPLLTQSFPKVNALFASSLTLAVTTGGNPIDLTPFVSEAVSSWTSSSSIAAIVVDAVQALFGESADRVQTSIHIPADGQRVIVHPTPNPDRYARTLIQFEPPLHVELAINGNPVYLVLDRIEEQGRRFFLVSQERLNTEDSSWFSIMGQAFLDYYVGERFDLTDDTFGVFLKEHLRMILPNGVQQEGLYFQTETSSTQSQGLLDSLLSSLPPKIQVLLEFDGAAAFPQKSEGWTLLYGSLELALSAFPLPWQERLLLRDLFLEVDTPSFTVSEKTRLAPYNATLQLSQAEGGYDIALDAHPKGGHKTEGIIADTLSTSTYLTADSWTHALYYLTNAEGMTGKADPVRLTQPNAKKWKKGRDLMDFVREVRCAPQLSWRWDETGEPENYEHERFGQFHKGPPFNYDYDEIDIGTSAGLYFFPDDPCIKNPIAYELLAQAAHDSFKTQDLDVRIVASISGNARETVNRYPYYSDRKDMAGTSVRPKDQPQYVNIRARPNGEIMELCYFTSYDGAEVHPRLDLGTGYYVPPLDVEGWVVTTAEDSACTADVFAPRFRDRYRDTMARIREINYPPHRLVMDIVAEDAFPNRLAHGLGLSVTPHTPSVAGKFASTLDMTSADADLSEVVGMGFGVLRSEGFKTGFDHYLGIQADEFLWTLPSMYGMLLANDYKATPVELDGRWVPNIAYMQPDANMEVLIKASGAGPLYVPLGNDHLLMNTELGIDIDFDADPNREWGKNPYRYGDDETMHPTLEIALSTHALKGAWVLANGKRLLSFDAPGTTHFSYVYATTLEGSIPSLALYWHLDSGKILEIALKHTQATIRSSNHGSH